MRGMLSPAPATRRVDGRYPGGVAGRSLRRRELDAIAARGGDSRRRERSRQGVRVTWHASADAANGLQTRAGVVVRTDAGSGRAACAGRDRGRRTPVDPAFASVWHATRRRPRRWAIGAYFEGVERPRGHRRDARAQRTLHRRRAGARWARQRVPRRPRAAARSFMRRARGGARGGDRWPTGVCAAGSIGARRATPVTGARAARRGCAERRRRGAVAGRRRRRFHRPDDRRRAAACAEGRRARRRGGDGAPRRTDSAAARLAGRGRRQMELAHKLRIESPASLAGRPTARRRRRRGPAHGSWPSIARHAHRVCGRCR